MAKRRGRRRFWTRRKKRTYKRTSTVARRNAKKIASNRRSIRKLQKETRESFTVKDDRIFQITDETRLPGQNTAICTIPIMPLFQTDPLPSSAPSFAWGAWGVRDEGALSAQADADAGHPAGGTGPAITNSLNFVRPITQRGAGAVSVTSIGNSGRYSKLRHTKCVIDFELRMEQWPTGSTNNPVQDITRFWRPRRVNVHMFIISARKGLADALLKDRGMEPTDFAPSKPAGTNGGVGFVNPTFAWQMGRNVVDNTGGYFGLRENEDFFLQNSMKFDPQWNHKLWNVHYTRRMRFGYMGDQPTFTSINNELGAAGMGGMLTYLPLPQLLSSGAKDPPNWYQRGRLSFPAYGNMYDMRPNLVNPSADVGAGGRGVSKVEVPNKMDRNDLSNERQRFIVFIHDGNRPQNYTMPGVQPPTVEYDPTAAKIMFQWSMKNSYTCSGGGMLD